MAAKTIISRPVYGTLSPQPGKHHLFVADAEGALAIIDMAGKAPAGFFDGAEIVFIAAPDGKHIAALEALKPAQLHLPPSFASLLPRLRQTLTNAHMGLRLYLSGTEGLIGQAMQVALEAGIDHTSMQTEHRGSLARRMQCVHCKGITENVTTQPATCAHCGLLLLVRDHYSRRLAAFQGVCINAEDRSEIPPMEEVFR
ncbi:hypothetical protein EN858_02945 [Mesorhizobium sp. M4B.F.Ca.ET.215.01.1.1]|uniref:Dimethylamine monooxygenase subunit DmmA family protein n=1 Tax=Mesorhizobium abyssinicae TaxID=1209958 RepID=A0ABU5APE1_9HYPH|nr:MULTISPECIES: dimethylamine monooxygenase subunit DmmA family protein [Mesorhizobium]RVC62857.1 hypothetical protein EN779_06645 [Mesorhizobium sp. M4B.F.Ca.ET.088.02.2.1]MDX8436310.1 dimethylamine monooxygenase subunit DmmA family protein [Mesorhizobium abyssinicae]MDX8539173.1 dimethylamine monooxygenase subunit DmmA family protein [Mesorhizobium abyssinicae]RUW26015.1 hypothetical protein EOA34_09795 [Mesorhizobium sp. M4B.F.Ca.ET.013.02.1.1]RVD39829.1 hypothetical protein EN741_18070 [M